MNGFPIRILAAARKTSIGMFNIPVDCTPMCDLMGKSTTATITFEAIRNGEVKMSVIQETPAGDEIVIIQEFNASPDGEGFSWATSRRFRVGERVRFVSFRQDPHYKDHP